MAWDRKELRWQTVSQAPVLLKDLFSSKEELCNPASELLGEHKGLSLPNVMAKFSFKIRNQRTIIRFSQESLLGSWILLWGQRLSYVPVAPGEGRLMPH